MSTRILMLIAALIGTQPMFAAVPYSVFLGTTAGDGTGTPARTAFGMINTNFSYLDALIAAQTNGLYAQLLTKQAGHEVLSNMVATVAKNVTNAHSLHFGIVNGTLYITNGWGSNLFQLATSGFVVKNGDAALARTHTGTSGEINVSNGDGLAGNPVYSLHADITRDAEVFAWLSTSNYIRQATSANGTFTPLLMSSNPVIVKTISGGSNVTITDQGGTNLQVSASTGGDGEANTSSNVGDGVGIANAKNLVDLPFKSFKSANARATWATNGTNITLTVDAQAPDASLTALSGVAGTGIIAQTAADTFVTRTITGTASEVTVTDGNGVAGNPTLAIHAAIARDSEVTAATATKVDIVDGTSQGHNATGALRTSGPKIDWPAKTPGGTLTVTGTNFWTIETNASFALTFSGTATNGQLMVMYVRNTNPIAHITVTNTATFAVPELGTTTNLINVHSNSFAVMHMRYMTNWVAGGQWYLESWQALLYGLVPGSNITFTTNANGTITIAASAGAAGDSVTVDGAATTDPNFDDGGQINFQYNAGTIIAVIKAGVVGNTNLAAMAQNRFKGRVSSGSGDPEDLTAAQALTVLESGGTDLLTSTEGVTLGGNQMITGVKGIGTLNVSTNLNAHSIFTTNGIEALSMDANSADFVTLVVSEVEIGANATFIAGTTLTPTSNGTNFTADYGFGVRQYNMTNHFWLSAIANAPLVNQWKGWSVNIRNNSGSTFTVGAATTFVRAGTNNVSLANGQRCKVILEPDLTGGSNLTNHWVQIIPYVNP